MQLFIAEKPSLGRAIASAFSSKEERDGYISINNDEIIVSWCFGHILEKTDFKKKARKIKNTRFLSTVTPIENRYC